jgi:hypothetical protein
MNTYSHHGDNMHHTHIQGVIFDLDLRASTACRVMPLDARANPLGFKFRSGFASDSEK